MKSKKVKLTIFVLFLIAICVACVYAPIQETQKLEDVESDTTVSEKNKEVIKVGFLNYPPYEFEEDGELKGIGIEMVREAFKRAGCSESDYVLIEYPWARLIEMMKEGRLHMLLDVAYTDERTAWMDYSKEVFGKTDISLMTRKKMDISYYGELEDVANVEIGIVRGYAYSSKFWDAVEKNSIQVNEAASTDELLNGLLTERYDLILEYKPPVLHMIKKNNWSDRITILTPPIDSNSSYIGYSKVHDLKELREQIDQAYRDMQADGTTERIYDKYLK